jgi:hypothetical protein
MTVGVARISPSHQGKEVLVRDLARKSELRCGDPVLTITGNSSEMIIEIPHL